MVSAPRPSGVTACDHALCPTLCVTPRGGSNRPAPCTPVCLVVQYMAQHMCDKRQAWQARHSHLTSQHVTMLCAQRCVSCHGAAAIVLHLSHRLTSLCSTRCNTCDLHKMWRACHGHLTSQHVTMLCAQQCPSHQVVVAVVPHHRDAHLCTSLCSTRHEMCDQRQGVTVVPVAFGGFVLMPLSQLSSMTVFPFLLM